MVSVVGFSLVVVWLQTSSSMRMVEMKFISCPFQPLGTPPGHGCLGVESDQLHFVCSRGMNIEDMLII